MNHILHRNWIDATAALAQGFREKYFPDADDSDCFWVGNRIGNPYSIGDHFFNIDRMVEALELEATQEQVLEFYDLELDAAMNEYPLHVNFRNFVKYGMPEAGDKK